MKIRVSPLATLLLLLLAVPLFGAQTAPGLSGRWEGEIKTPGEGVAMILEFARSANDRWQGIASFPSQPNVKLRLLNLKVDGAAVSFDMPAAPGYPAFKGKVTPDGQAISGEFMQGGQSLTIELKRNGDSTFKPAAPAAPSPALDAVKGEWEGDLEVGGRTLRLKFKLDPNAGSDIPGILNSLDQQSLIPVDAVVAEKDAFRIDLNLIQGSFTGKLSADGSSWQGTWDQPGVALPLTLKRPAASRKP